jgi:hypothetical protein
VAVEDEVEVDLAVDLEELLFVFALLFALLLLLLTVIGFEVGGTGFGIGGGVGFGFGAGGTLHSQLSDFEFTCQYPEQGVGGGFLEQANAEGASSANTNKRSTSEKR